MTDLAASEGGPTRDFGEFFDAAMPKLLRAAERITGQRATAEDAACEALARCWVRWDRLSRASWREAWVMRVTINLAVESVRTSSRRKRILRRQPPPPNARPADEALGDDRLRRAIEELPGRQREVLLLRYTADFDTAAIAGALGVSTGAVKRYQHRALATLRSKLGPDAAEAMGDE